MFLDVRTANARTNAKAITMNLMWLSTLLKTPILEIWLGLTFAWPFSETNRTGGSATADRLTGWRARLVGLVLCPADRLRVRTPVLPPALIGRGECSGPASPFRYSRLDLRLIGF